VRKNKMALKNINNKKPNNFEKRYGLPPSVRKLKLTNRIKTVNDLLTRSDVNDVLDELSKNKSDVTDMIVIYKTSNNLMHYSYAINDNNNETLRVLGMVEYFKNMILNGDDE
jgi:hypothetical protein